MEGGENNLASWLFKATKRGVPSFFLFRCSAPGRQNLTPKNPYPTLFSRAVKALKGKENFPPFFRGFLLLNFRGVMLGMFFWFKEENWRKNNRKCCKCSFHYLSCLPNFPSSQLPKSQWQGSSKSSSGTSSQAGDGNLLPLKVRKVTFFQSVGANSQQYLKFTLPETNSSPLKMDGWNTSFLLGRPIFRGYVSFREVNFRSG